MKGLGSQDQSFLGLFFECHQFDPGSGGFAQKEEQNHAKDFKHTHHQNHTVEVGIEPVEEENEYKEGGVEEEAKDLKEEEEGDAMDLACSWRAAEDEQISQ